MSSVTKNVSQYVNKKGINLSKMSRDTGIQYGKLYAKGAKKEPEKAAG